MSGHSQETARKAAATRLGIPINEYLDHLASGEKWCMACQAWHSINDFGPDPSRYDGREARCYASRRNWRQKRSSATTTGTAGA